MKKIIAGIAILIALSTHAQLARLTVGDKAPSIIPFKWIKGKISGFQTGKVYLVEFGATWCVPCRKSIPHLSALQKEFAKNLTVIGMFVMEPKKDEKDLTYIDGVRNFIKGQGNGINYIVGTDDPKGTLQKNWLKNAGLEGLPHAFIIDKSGRIAWVGNPQFENLGKIIKDVNGPDYTVQSAIEMNRLNQVQEPQKIESEIPLYLDGNGGDPEPFLARSILTKYRGERAPYIDYISSPQFRKDKKYPAMVQQVGVPIDKLYYIAYADTIGQWVFSRMVGTNEYPDTNRYPAAHNRYGNYWYKPIMEVSDSTPFVWNFRSEQNRYNYNLTIAKDQTTAADLQIAMRKDLDTYFGYKVSVEQRMMPYWRITATPEAKMKLKAKQSGKFYAVRKDTLVTYHNAVMKDIMLRLIYPFSAYANGSYGLKTIEEAPFVDETGIDGFIDYDISDNEFKNTETNKDWGAALNFLHRLGLDLQKGERLTKVVVIRDPKKE